MTASTPTANDRLLAVVKNVEALFAERRSFSENLKAALAEGKTAGFSPKYVKALVKARDGEDGVKDGDVLNAYFDLVNKND